MRALVTGAGRRLGRHMALYLAQRGYDMALHYASSRDEAEGLAEEIRAMGRKAVCLRADLLVEAQTAKLVATAAQGLGGPISVLVNSASIFEHDSFASVSRKSWDRHIESNLRAPFVLSQSFAAQAPRAILDEAGEPFAQALIVNMIDQRVHKLTPDYFSYTIAKMGLWAMTRTAAQALAPDIRVNAIGPGPTLQGGRQSAELFAKQRQSTVLARGANPSDITAALGFFLDSPAVTGQMIAVDGGQHLAWATPDVIGVE
ncbi:MAG: SDR family oxidoreductase [Cypionkella sp.]|nr:SDR family oxidoreductase [Cypionkella sp.]